MTASMIWTLAQYCRPTENLWRTVRSAVGLRVKAECKLLQLIVRFRLEERTLCRSISTSVANISNGTTVEVATICEATKSGHRYTVRLWMNSISWHSVAIVYTQFIILRQITIQGMTYNSCAKNNDSTISEVDDDRLRPGVARLYGTRRCDGLGSELLRSRSPKQSKMWESSSSPNKPFQIMFRSRAMPGASQERWRTAH